MLTWLSGLSLKQWLQIGAAIVVAVVLFWAYGSFKHLQSEAAKVPGLKAEVAARTAELTQLRKDYDETQTASKGFQDELARLRTTAAAAGPVPVVRVCKPAPELPRPATPQPGPDEGAPAGGVLPQEPGPDIGPALYGDADLADTLSAQIRGLHYYIENVCHAQKAGT